MYALPALTLLVCTLPPVSALELYHRLLSSSSPSPWSLRATVDLSHPQAHYHPSPDAASVLLAESAAGGEGVYQVALAVEGREEEEWAWAGVKACFASSALSDTLILRISSSGEPYTLSYALDPAPSSAHCPSVSVASASLFQNTTILVRGPDRIPPLALKTPPQLSETGETIKPEREKSFIEKYWMYALPVLLLLLMSPGGEGEGGQAAAGGGGGGGGGGR